MTLLVPQLGTAIFLRLLGDVTSTPVGQRYGIHQE
jgi:hypothetical protein